MTRRYFAIFSSAAPSQDSPSITAAFQFGCWRAERITASSSDGFVIGFVNVIVVRFSLSCRLPAGPVVASWLGGMEMELGMCWGRPRSDEELCAFDWWFLSVSPPVVSVIHICHGIGSSIGEVWLIGVSSSGAHFLVWNQIIMIWFETQMRLKSVKHYNPYLVPLLCPPTAFPFDHLLKRRHHPNVSLANKNAAGNGLGLTGCAMGKADGNMVLHLSTVVLVGEARQG